MPDGMLPCDLSGLIGRSVVNQDQFASISFRQLRGQNALQQRLQVDFLIEGRNQNRNRFVARHRSP
jgi:hypothetical protein